MNKSHLTEMVIKGKGFCDTSLFHHNIGCTVCERPFFVKVEPFKYLPCLIGDRFINLNHLQDFCVNQFVYFSLVCYGNMIANVS